MQDDGKQDAVTPSRRPSAQERGSLEKLKNRQLLSFFVGLAVAITTTPWLGEARIGEATLAVWAAAAGAVPIIGVLLSARCPRCNARIGLALSRFGSERVCPQCGMCVADTGVRKR